MQSMEEEQPQHFGGIYNYFEGATIHNLVINGNMTKSGPENYTTEAKQVDIRDTQPAKKDIISYVDRLKPMVKEEYLNQYDSIWEGILELRDVKLSIYNKGKQQDTKFNRNLVAQIIYQLKDRLFIPSANTVTMAECLEPEKGGAHPVRQKLGEMPDKPIKNSIEEYVKGCF